MRNVRISDETMKRGALTKELSLTFKEKLELAKLLDNSGVSVIEIEGIEKPKADALRIKSISSLTKKCTLAVPVKLDGSDVEDIWAALEEATSARLQVQVATSPSRMEYVHKLKAETLVSVVADTIKQCREFTDNVEFIAEDATRTDSDYLATIVRTAIDAGATTVTICDDAGKMLPDEFKQFMAQLKSDIPELEHVTLGISVSNDLFMAVSSTMAGIIEGAGEVKTTTYPLGVTQLPKLARAIASKSDSYGFETTLNMTALNRTALQIERICEQGKVKSTSFAAAAVSETESDITLSVHDSREAVAECVTQLGYDLTDEDISLVYESFMRIASKKENVGGKELDAIVASVAMQVPPTYKLERYTINSGNSIKATAYLKIIIGDKAIEKTGMGDGPIDAAFAAIDEIVGKTYELDDWQMAAVTEGQEAMGEAVIKLRSDGKVYSGRGISTDIIGSSIRAYLNALNKVVFEEDNQ